MPFKVIFSYIKLIVLLLLLNIGALWASDCEQVGFWKKCGSFYTHANGDVYQGQFKGRNPHGKGTLTIGGKSPLAGDKYKGSFSDGIKHGDGVYFHKNGDQYIGNWSGGMKNGEGIFYSNQKKFKQYFEYGIPISSVEYASKSSNSKKETTRPVRPNLPEKQSLKPAVNSQDGSWSIIHWLLILAGIWFFIQIRKSNKPKVSEKSLKKSIPTPNVSSNSTPDSNQSPHPVGGSKANKKRPKKKREETYFGPPQLKFIDEEHKETGWLVKKIMFRGRLPNTRDMNISFAISAFDVTDGEGKFRPALSIVEGAQEETTICYYMADDFGRVGEGSSLTDWVQLGVVIPELIQPPYSGNREIHMVVRMFNTDNPVTIVAGGASDNGEVILLETLSFNHDFKDKGYEEASQDREESQSISLKIGVAVAMSDGSLDDSEGDVLKNWIIKEVSAFSGNKQKQLKAMFNKSLKEGFAEAKNGDLSLSNLVERLSKIGDKKSKYDAVELCLDVMAADGIADPEEMAVIRNVAKSLDLDMDEIEKMREKVTLSLSTELTSEEGLESLVGIDPSWSDEQKRKHLRTEFQKWNNRLNSLSDAKEKESAQSMLDNIATLRKKYG